MYPIAKETKLNKKIKFSNKTIKVFLALKFMSLIANKNEHNIFYALNKQKNKV